jgi:hypothetical protein
LVPAIVGLQLPVAKHAAALTAFLLQCDLVDAAVSDAGMDQVDDGDAVADGTVADDALI